MDLKQLDRPVVPRRHGWAVVWAAILALALSASPAIAQEPSVEDPLGAGTAGEEADTGTEGPAPTESGDEVTDEGVVDPSRDTARDGGSDSEASATESKGGDGVVKATQNPYEPSEPPSAPPAPQGEPPAPAPAPTTASETVTPEAPTTASTPTTTESAPAVPQTSVTTGLPVTGLAVGPIALAGLAMLVLGGLGLRRTAHRW